MRYFKIYNKGCTKTRPLQELTKDQYLADIADYCLNKISFMVEDEAFDAMFSDLFNKAELFANCETGLGCGDFYLYSAGDDKTVLDFNRKNC